VHVAGVAVEFNVLDGSEHPRGIVLELPKATVAPEAQNAADLTSGVIVVDVDRRLLATNRARPAMSFDHDVYISGGYSVAPGQMIVARSSVKPVLRLFAARVVTWLAVRMTAVFVVLVAGKPVQRLELTTVGTAFTRLEKRTLTQGNPPRSEPSTF
jgi:hypothetical protein